MEFRKRPESGTQRQESGSRIRGETAGHLHQRRAPNPRAELEETVRLIRRMVREDGMRYQDFAVLTGDLFCLTTAYARNL